MAYARASGASVADARYPGASMAQAAEVPIPGSAAPIPPDARALGPLPARTGLHLDVVLRSRNPAQLASFAQAVSTPASPLYRHFLARGAFEARFGPTQATIVSVRAWLREGGLAPGVTSANGLIVPVRASIAQAERMFGVRIEGYRMPSGRLAFSPEGSTHLPRNLTGGVVAVLGLSSIARPHALAVPRGEPAALAAPGHALASARAEQVTGGVLRAHQAGPQACPQAAAVASETSSYTATQLAQAYSFAPLYSQGRLGAGVTVAVYELEPYLASDVAAYQSCFGTSASVSNVLVDGGPGQGAGTGEAALDVETVAGLAPMAHILVYEGPDTTSQAALDVYNQIAVDDQAQVVSTSWGLCEAQLGTGTINAEAQIFQQMAAQGQSVVAAAGDSGSEDCYAPPQSSDAALAVDDPGSQPWVTSAGGTSLTSIGPPPSETVWDDSKGAGGGGVSSVWTMPSWQAGPGVTNAYSTGAPCGAPSGSYCREVPDVSASADPMHGSVVYHAGGWTVIGGTSDAAPLWAALLALSDSGCFTPGEGPGNVVGMANPAIYELGSGSDPPFNAVTSGENQFVVPDPAPPASYPPGPYFPAGTGYSMAAGWGSPIASQLLADLQPAGGCPLVTGLSPSTGPAAGGTVVTISGLDLAGVIGVSIGGSEATNITYDQAGGTVQATVPPGSAGSSEAVSVTTLNGTSPTVPAGFFTYEAASSQPSPGQPPSSQAPPPPGYWLVGSDGGVFAFGDAGFYGSMAGKSLAAPVVGMAATPDAKGYWLVGSDGGVFAFGDAGFYGSMAGKSLAAPVVGEAGSAAPGS